LRKRLRIAAEPLFIQHRRAQRRCWTALSGIMAQAPQAEM
jgi:hypothetical protein